MSGIQSQIKRSASRRGPEPQTLANAERIGVYSVVLTWHDESSLSVEKLFSGILPHFILRKIEKKNLLVPNIRDALAVYVSVCDCEI